MHHIVENEYTNEFEFRIFSMKHSGCHAIINWIATLFDEPVYFFNNCGFGEDPFRTGRTRGDRIGTPIEDIFVKVPKLKNVKKDKIEEVRNKYKKCLIYSYENIDLRKFEKREITPRKYVGKSHFKFDVLIIRDLLNWAASTFKYTGRLALLDLNFARDLDARNCAQRRKLFDGWKSHAFEFLGKTEYLENKICISYNDWLNKDYREKTALKFMLINNEISIDTVAAINNKGSQFNGLSYDGKASKMKVLERWHHFTNNIYFWKLFDDPELFELSEEIFGEKIKG